MSEIKKCENPGCAELVRNTCGKKYCSAKCRTEAFYIKQNKFDDFISAPISRRSHEIILDSLGFKSADEVRGLIAEVCR